MLITLFPDLRHILILFASIGKSFSRRDAKEDGLGRSIWLTESRICPNASGNGGKTDGSGNEE